MLAGNKSDLPTHTVDKDKADQFARSKGIEHVLTSAQTGKNIDYVFSTLAEKMIASRALQESQQRQSGAATGPARKTGRGQLRVEGVQEFNPAGNAPVTLSRKSEKVAKDK